jgi:hypothetical protein
MFLKKQITFKNLWILFLFCGGQGATAPVSPPLNPVLQKGHEQRGFFSIPAINAANIYGS